MATLIAGIGLLEVVLLAGRPPFAVGARRQTRDLGLVAASGGSAHHVRRIVLAKGCARRARRCARRGRRVRAGDRRAPAVGAARRQPHRRVGLRAVGRSAGAAADRAPLRPCGRARPGDRRRPHAARGRPRRSGSASSAARDGSASGVGGALVLAGVALGLAGDVLLADDFAAYERALATAAENGIFISAPTPTGPVAMIVLGDAAGGRPRDPRPGRDRRARGARGPPSPLLAARGTRRRPPPPPHRPGDERDRRRGRGVGRARLPARRQPAGRGAAAHPVAPRARDDDHARRRRRRGGRRPRRERAGDAPRRRAARASPPALRRPAPGTRTWRRARSTSPRLPARATTAASPARRRSPATPRSTRSSRAGRSTRRPARLSMPGAWSCFSGRSMWTARSSSSPRSTPADVSARAPRLPAHLVRRDVHYSLLPAALMTEAVARRQGWETEATVALVRYDPSATEDQIEAVRMGRPSGSERSPRSRKGPASPPGRSCSSSPRPPGWSR